MSEPAILQIRATEAHRTYIGASFCPNESELRSFCESGPAERTLVVNQLRTDAQHGQTPDVSQETAGLGMRQKSRAALNDCLSAIAMGNCSVYPPLKS